MGIVVTSEEFEKQLIARATYAANRVGSEIALELKQVLSVPAPRRTTASGRIVATTKATPGSPPRKLTGHGRANVAYYVDAKNGVVTIYVGDSVVYMRKHEELNHKWLMKTINAMMPKITANFQKYFNKGQ